MGKYCDSTKLEQNWFNWLLASSVPQLDDFRQSGLLWTRVVGRARNSDREIITNKEGKTFSDACDPYRLHCLALGKPVYFSSQDGEPSHCTVDSEEISLDSTRSELTLESNSKIHNLDNPFATRDEVIPALEAEGYQFEVPESVSWDLMLNDINNMCIGIGMKFHPPNEEELHDLANEALLQVCNKLQNRKLVYTPGLAPVFNLLTTTIYRCMYSICNRKTQQRKGSHKFVSEAKAGILPDNIRSFRLVGGELPNLRSQTAGDKAYTQSD